MNLAYGLLAKRKTIIFLMIIASLNILPFLALKKTTPKLGSVLVLIGVYFCVFVGVCACECVSSVCVWWRMNLDMCPYVHTKLIVC